MKRFFWVICTAILFVICYTNSVVFAREVYDKSEMESLADDRYEKAKDKATSIYDNAMEHVENSQTLHDLKSGDPGKVVFRFFYNFYYAVKKVAVYIGGFSILIGLFLCWLVKHNKYLMRKLFLTFVLGVPAGLAAFCFGVGILIG